MKPKTEEPKVLFGKSKKAKPASLFKKPEAKPTPAPEAKATETPKPEKKDNGIDLHKAPKKNAARFETERPQPIAPHTEIGEHGVLGCILLDPAEILPEAQADLAPEEFFDLRHRTIYEVLLTMAEDPAVGISRITFPSLIQTLTDRQQREAVGGVAFISSLMDSVPAASNFGYYRAQMREKFVRRRLLQVCDETVAKIRFPQEEMKTEELVDAVQMEILKVTESRTSKGERSTKEIIRAAIPKWEERYIKNAGKLDGLGTGFTDLDDKLWGMRGGELIVLGGRPASGKTSLMMNIVEHVGVTTQIPTGVISLEMGDESLVLRTICSMARVDAMKLRRGTLTDEEWQRYYDATSKLAASPIFIDERSGLTHLQIRASFRRMVQKHKIKLGVVDYLQLVGSKTKNGENREREVAQVSNGLKSTAKDLDIPIVVLAQLNREMEKGKTKRKPRPSDLRESGAIEADADVIGLLYDPNEEEHEGDSQRVEFREGLILAKNRNGATGEISLWFRKHLTRFEQYRKAEHGE